MLNPFYTGYPHQQQQQLYPSVSQPPSYPFGALLQTNQQQYGQFEQEKSIDELMQLYLSNDDQKPPPYPFNGSQQQQKQQQQQQLIFDQLDKYLNMQQPPQPKVQAQICPVYPPPPIQQQSPMYQPPPIQQPPMYPPPNHPPFYNGLPYIPILTEELSKNLDPSYSKEFDVLYILLQNATSKEELEMIFSGFAKKFLVLPALWKYRLQLQSKHFTNIQSDEEIQITRRALHDFYSIETFSRYQSFKCFDRIFLTGWIITYKWTSTSNPFINLTGIMDSKRVKEYLLYPHQHLVDVYNFYEENGDQILLQKEYLKYKKALNHCHRILAAESLRQLFCCFTEIEDDPKVVIQNVELLIAQNPTCQWLWKSYLQFLRDRQPKVYLDVFHKYIRFFISDKPMIDYYEQEQQRIFSTINLNCFLSLENFLMDEKEHQPIPLNSLRIHNSSTFKNHFEQKFSFPPTLIKYILKKASAKQLNTLFETCKQMFLLQPTPICCNLTVSNYNSCYDGNYSRSTCFQQSFKFSNFIPWELQNIFLVKSLIIEASKPVTMLRTIIGKISRCEIWLLNVIGQRIFWDELKFLLESGNIEKFVFMGGYIDAGYGQMVTIEDVIEMLPKAHTINLDSAVFTPQTFPYLSAFNRLAKFKEFKIERIFASFQIFDFEYFILKHAAPNSYFNFVFEAFTPNNFIKKFDNFVKNVLFQDWPFYQTKPRISITKKK